MQYQYTKLVGAIGHIYHVLTNLHYALFNDENFIIFHHISEIIILRAKKDRYQSLK